MTFTATKKKGSQIELVVELAAEDLADYVRQTEQELAAGLNLPGFRPGKAPAEAVRKHVGEEAIRQEALNLAIQRSLGKILAEEKYDVIEQEKFAIKENSKNKLVYTLTLIVFPEVKLGTYTGISVAAEPVAVENKDIDTVLEDVRRSRAKLEPVSRPVISGDKVEVDFTVTENGKVIEGGESQNHPLVVGEGTFIPGFEDQIVGMSEGQSKEFPLVIPTDYYQKSIAGKTLACRVTLKKAESRTLPEVSDAFAQTLGNFQTVADLKENIRQGLIQEKESRERDRVRLALMEKIAGTAECEIPQILVERQLDLMVQEFEQELHRRGMELNLYLSHIKKSIEEIRKEWQPKAERQVKLSLVSRAIARHEHIAVTDEEIESEFSLIAEQYAQMGKLDALKSIDPGQLKSRLEHMLLNEKIYKYLEQNNPIS